MVSQEPQGKFLDPTLEVVFKKFVLAMQRQGMSANKISQAILQPVQIIQSNIEEVKKH